MSWAKRVAESSPNVNQSKIRGMQQARAMIDAAYRLIRERGTSFTTQELAKEAGVALQTFYRYFSSKDQLLMAVLGDMIAAGCVRFAAAAADLPDPVTRLRFYITSTLKTLTTEGDDGAAARFVVSSHWELQRQFPDEMADAVQPFADLLLSEINAGIEAGLLHPPNSEAAAWFLNELVRTVYHHYTYSRRRPPSLGDDLWQFCLSALGGIEH